MMTMPWRCVLIGTESLLVRCAEALLHRGHDVVAVVSEQPAIARWAAERDLLILPDPEALLARPDLPAFDYLFSITNLAVLSDEVLSLPTRAAINFHDGPLPDYAGLNTPVWALLNGEAEHGVTWHMMTGKVDCGDLLVTQRFDVDPSETALTLNAKCFEAGMESFEALLDGIDRGRSAPARQPDGNRRSYGRRDRPAAAGMIRWDADAADVARLVRALDFGAYANPLGMPKAVYAGQVVLVKEVEERGQASSASAGTIVAVEPDAIVVASASNELALRRFATLAGEPLDAVAAAERFGIIPGRSFESLTEERAARLSELDAAAAVHEPFWLRRLKTQAGIDLPYSDRASMAAPSPFRHAELKLTASDEPARADSIFAAVVGYLARLVDKQCFDVGFACPVLAAQFGDVAGWFAPQVPLRADLDFEWRFGELRDHIDAELSEVRRRIGICADLVARTPQLGAGGQGDPRVLPVAVMLVDALGSAEALPASELTIAIQTDGSACRWIYDPARLTGAAIAEMQAQFVTFLAAADAEPDRRLAELPLTNDAQRRSVEAWNATAAAWRDDACIHRLIAEQAARTPNRTAVICGESSLDYGELDRRANRLARHLAALGVRPGILVGVFVERSVEMMIGLLAILKAGGAYVPLDPAYPQDRVRHMIEDSSAAVMLTQAHLADKLPPHEARVVRLDADWPAIAVQPDEDFDGGAAPSNLAYVIYTSGSTGLPKGVMVEHRNVVNFFAGIDRVIGGDEPGTWLAVTSLSFDISVLELFWTLARGYEVVLYTGDDRMPAAAASLAQAGRAIDFSLFYFASDESEGATDKYRLLLEGTKYADRNGFAAVWTPERHFHAFGGLYPNPAVTSAAIAAITDRIGIRSGSVVLPLHHPVRVAEEWSVVDNLSNGRVGISFASGWQPNDFVLRPENLANNKEVMLHDIDVVRRLWRGETMSFPGPLGSPVELRTLPRPVQKELPFWMTSAGNVETFTAAGRMGACVLTHLLGQTVDELIEKLAAYRQAWRNAGHRGEGYVTLMLHSFVGPDAEAVREKVRRPLIEYLRSSTNLVKQYAWSFPAFKRRPGMEESSAAFDLQSLTDEEMDALLEHSFDRYYETSGLFGTPESCLSMIERLKAVGVDDVACLIDFGIDSATVLSHLPYLNELRLRSAPAETADGSLAALMRRHNITHLQCTPSLASMLLADRAAVPCLAGLRRMMVGGEAFPGDLARELRPLVGGELMNMYGPTETTIWSSVEVVGEFGRSVPLGRPLANQNMLVVDGRGQLVPPGVPGELMIGGNGVVRGYLGRPELTAERFVAHPLRAGELAYRTGDLVRQGHDGTLEFLGRLDHQVKLRGFRIELGEIEAVLAAQPDVREAVVVAREENPGDTRIIAYVVGAGGRTPSSTTLRDSLREKLPEFMLPAHIVPLTALPRTPNGKIDRRALPLPDAVGTPAPTTAFVAPEAGVEEKIAAVWRDVLKLPQVGTRDNFFDLGGHSLLAVQVHRQLQATLGRKLSITDIFRFPTIQALSAFLSRGDGESLSVQKVQNRARGRLAALQRVRLQRAVTSANGWS